MIVHSYKVMLLSEWYTRYLDLHIVDLEFGTCWCTFSNKIEGPFSTRRILPKLVIINTLCSGLFDYVYIVEILPNYDHIVIVHMIYVERW